MIPAPAGCRTSRLDPAEARRIELPGLPTPHRAVTRAARCRPSRPVFVTHARPEPFLGLLRRIDTGPVTAAALGFVRCVDTRVVLEAMRTVGART